MSFEQIIGHEKIIKHFKNAITNDRVAHSYLFEGSKGIGKRTMGKALAKELLSQDKTMNITNHPDFKIIETTDSTIKKEMIKELQKDIKIKPHSGNKKVYIISEGEKMTPEAQNSFLKTLEEPPSYVTIIITTTNKEKLLKTIVSRCQPVEFHLISTKKIEDLLVEKYKKTYDQAKFIANFSNGIVGRAILLCEGELETLREDTLRAIDNTIKSGKEKVFTTSEFFEKNKESIDEILDMMTLYFRDILIYAETNCEDFIINSDKMESIKSHSNYLAKHSLHDIINSIMITKHKIDLKVNFSLCIEMMLLEIQEGGK